MNTLIQNSVVDRKLQEDRKRVFGRIIHHTSHFQRHHYFFLGPSGVVVGGMSFCVIQHVPFMPFQRSQMPTDYRKVLPAGLARASS
jgi:hypothetical protein